jgi:DNA-binding response OmpR family regulator
MSRSILFFQDDCDTGALWASLLRQKELVVTCVDLNAGAADLYQEQNFDLIIVNLCTAYAQGLDACRKLRGLFINPILLLASAHTEAYVLQAYEAGIDEFIPTSIDPRILLAKLNAWLRHTWTISTAALGDVQVDKIRLDTEKRAVIIPNRPSQKLTNLEFRVLHLLMTHPGKNLETSFILDRVWGYADNDDNSLLKNVIYRLRRKIEPDPAQPSYIVTVPGVGYTFQS